MKHFCIYFLTCLLIVSCQKNYDKRIEPHHLIPESSNIIIKVNALNDFKNGIETNPILNTLYNKDIKKLKDIIDEINSESPIYLALDSLKTDNYLILTKCGKQIFKTDSLSNISIQTIENDIHKVSIDSMEIYQKQIYDIHILSNTAENINSIETNTEPNYISELIKTTDETSVASIIFKVEDFDGKNLLLSRFSGNDYAVIDVNNSANQLIYNGVITTKDSITNYLNVFKNVIPQKINAPSIIPNSVKNLKCISFDDFETFNNNLKTINKIVTDSSNSFLKYTNEVALIDNALILHSLDTELLKESIEAKSFEETFRDVDIYSFEESDYFQNRLKPIIEFEDASYFFTKDNFVVFSNTIDTLKNIISDVLNNNTLIKSETFKNILDNLSDESSLFIYKDSESLSELFQKDLKGYNSNGVQYIYEDNYAHINGIIQKFKKPKATNTVSENFSVSIENDIIVGPQVLTNHVNKTKDIAIQDINNKLYLISNSGNILWSKTLQGKILGEIKQMDIYKNGRLQLVFATPKRVYVLDRNGNDVGPFPLKFNDEITQPLSVFDYDKKRDYRLLVTQSKNLLMYNQKGKRVNGFNYKSDNNDIITQPSHFRIGSKDYIVFASGENLKILNRRGAIRVNVTKRIRFSGNKIYNYQNKFTSTNTLGELTQINTKGKVTTKPLNLPEKHKIDATSKTLVTLSENNLTIRSNIINLEYGDYSEPRIFYLNDKIYITVTDFQSKKIFLFDSQGRPIPNFPVYGVSSAVLTKLDKDKNLELITQSDSNTILIYKLY